MKVALCSSFVPLLDGGLRSIVDWLAEHLIEHGHRVEIIWLPFVQNPQTMFRQITAYRMIDIVGSVDKLVAFRPPAYVIPHPNKTLWFIHHFRPYYDLWDKEKYRPRIAETEYGKSFRRHLIAADTRTIKEAKHIYTNSRVVSDRLKHFNGIDSEVLYPPLHQAERFRCSEYGEEILCISRKEEHKRQDLLIDAMRFVRSDVKLRLCGVSVRSGYPEELRNMVESKGLQDRVTLDDRWISDDEKIKLVSEALAVAYIPLDEDSYGYPILEGAQARRPIITTTDSGGTLEFVENGRNGFLCEPTPEALAARFDELYQDRALARRLGRAAYERIGELNIDWNRVIERILA